MNKELKTIQRASRIGLWGSVAAVILTVAFLYSPWQFRNPEHAVRWMTVAGTVLAVLAVSMSLLTARRQVPRLRQTEDTQAKLEGYAAYVRQLYLTMLAVVVILCLFTVLSARSPMLMLAMVSTLVLVLTYPNIYRIKADLGLDDEAMRSLFGDKYIGGDGK